MYTLPTFTSQTTPQELQAAKAAANASVGADYVKFTVHVTRGGRYQFRVDCDCYFDALLTFKAWDAWQGNEANIRMYTAQQLAA